MFQSLASNVNSHDLTALPSAAAAAARTLTAAPAAAVELDARGQSAVAARDECAAGLAEAAAKAAEAAATWEDLDVAISRVNCWADRTEGTVAAMEIRDIWPSLSTQMDIDQEVTTQVSIGLIYSIVTSVPQTASRS